MLTWHGGPICRALLRQRWAVALVVAQIGLGLLIAVRSAHVGDYVMSGLLVPTGTDEAGLVVVQVQSAALSEGHGPAQAADLAALRGLPGVLAVSPVDGDPLGQVVRASDSLLGPVRRDVVGGMSLAGGAGLARALGLRLVGGRDFAASDAGARVTPAIISRQLADKLLDGEPVGQRFRSREVGLAEVVGVAEHLALKPTRGAVEHTVLYFRALADTPDWRFVVRSTPEGARALVHEIPARLAADDRAVTAGPANGYRLVVFGSTRSVLLVVAVVIAVILAVVGVGQFAVTAYLVQERTRQVGLRRALGATRTSVLGHFLLENLVVTLAGVGLGMVVHLGLLYRFGSLVDGVPSDPRITAGCALLLLFIGQVATFLPAYQAASIPPSVASRTA